MNIKVGGFTPLFLSAVSAGFPQTADDQVEAPLDLNEYLIKHPSATYFVRVVGESMIGAGIYPKDILIVDRSLTPHNGSVVVAAVDGEFTVKRLNKDSFKECLISDNDLIEPIVISDEGVEIWGVVTHSIRHHM